MSNYQVYYINGAVNEVRAADFRVEHVGKDGASITFLDNDGRSLRFVSSVIQVIEVLPPA